MPNETYPFGRTYQIKLLRLISTSKEFMLGYRPVLSPEYFEDDRLQDISRLMLDYYDKHREVPTLAAVEEAVNDLLRADKRRKKLEPEFKAAMKAISDAGVEEQSDIVARAIEFAQESAIAVAINQSISDLEEGNRDKPLKRIREAMQVGQNLSRTGLDLFTDTSRFSWSRSAEAVATGFGQLDRYLGGGLSLKELGVIAGGAGGFKSGTLINLAAAGIEQGCQVVYQTFELLDMVVAKRMDRRLSVRFEGMPPELLHNEAYLERLQEYQRRVRGGCIVNWNPSGTVTLSAFRAYLHMLKDMGKFARPGKKSLLIVDYGQLFKPEGRAEKDTQAIREMYQGLIQIAAEFDCPVWTAMQATRLAVARQRKSGAGSAGSKLIHKDDLAECFAVAADADVIMSVNQDLEEKEANRMRLFLAKVREAEDGRVVNMKINYEKMHLSEASLPRAKGVATKKASTVEDIMRINNGGDA